MLYQLKMNPNSSSSALSDEEISIWFCFYTLMWVTKSWIYLIQWCFCVSACVFPTGVLPSVWPTRAATKKECTPPFSQVPSVMTGKVIDYTPQRANRAKGVLQRDRREQGGADIRHTYITALLNVSSICRSSSLLVNYAVSETQYHKHRDKKQKK